MQVQDVAHGGHCIARHEGRVLFVRHALPGERVTARVTEGGTRSRFVRADAVQILQPSPERVSARCAVAGPGGCGGCDWQHTSTAFGRELKRRVVAEQLDRLAGLDWDGEVEAVPGDQDGLRWRTRVEFAADADHRLGLRRHRSRDVVAVDDCPIAVPEIAATGVLAEPVEPGVTGTDVAVDSAGEVIAVDLPEDDEEPVPSVVERVATRRGEREFEVSARGFWQVHPGAAATFVDAVLDGLQPQPGDQVLDLYAGVGVFTAFAADAVGVDGRVFGLEGDERAVVDSLGNLADLPNAAVLRRGIGKGRWADAIDRELGDTDLVILDPPRSGAGRDVMREITDREPRRIAYVACDPAALARDLSYAADAGYRATTIRAFDSFPMTHHVECVAILEPGLEAPN